MGDLVSAVLQLRNAIGDSQQAFATRLGLSVRAVANYEAGREPAGRPLAQMMQVARAAGLPELEKVFRDGLSAELGYEIPGVASSKTIEVGPGEEPDFDALVTILRGGKRWSGVKKKWGELCKPVKDANAHKDYRAVRDIGLVQDILRRVRDGQSVDAIASALKVEVESVQAIRDTFQPGVTK